MAGCVQPHTHVLLRLQSDIQKVVEIVPNSTITLPKVGVVPTNLILGRPYFYTYELVEQPQSDETNSTEQSQSTETANDFKRQKKQKHKNSNRQAGRTCVSLRIVPPSEIHREALANKDEATNGTSGGDVDGDSEAETATPSSCFSLPNTPAEAQKSNRLTVDDGSRQQLTMEEIEALKKAQLGSGKEIIEKIKQAHLGLEEKTEFSLAKYTLRKERKYLKRFTLLPLDTALLAEYLMEKEAFKIMELRRETLSLITSWANVRWSDNTATLSPALDLERQEILSPAEPTPQGRWLVMDDTGGLVIAALAEKMGILHPPQADPFSDSDSESEFDTESKANNTSAGLDPNSDNRTALKPKGPEPMSSTSNTLTVVHSAHQPNLGLLQYFGFNPNEPSPTHPLYTHLHTLSWLQLLQPAADSGYTEPPVLSPTELSALKSNKRSTYFRKRKRWSRIKTVVDTARAGGFDGLVMATTMDLVQPLRAALPLLKGGARVVIFSPSIEPLTGVVDMFSKERKSAWLKRLDELVGELETTPSAKTDSDGDVDMGGSNVSIKARLEEAKKKLEDEFELDPTMLLAPAIQTSRARAWQVLPGRTHPLMTSRGGSEGFILTSTRVLAHEGKVEAKGVYMKKRRTD